MELDEQAPVNGMVGLQCILFFPFSTFRIHDYQMVIHVSNMLVAKMLRFHFSAVTKTANLI